MVGSPVRSTFVTMRGGNVHILRIMLIFILIPVMMQHHQQQQPIAQVQGIPSQSRSMSITSQESV